MDNRLGSLEELLLLAVGSLGSESYAVTIQQRIEEVASNAPSMGAVYTSLERLEQKGYLLSSLGDVSPQPGGRRKRHYRLSGSGSQAVIDVRSARERLWSIMGASPQLGQSK
ncbi:MAG: PadR family transcriptional regulator [Bacteroidetes bacterium]|nr:PadR family transcriptional regulator [Bacteroidota bacterium]